jgi:ribosomal protein L40E
MPAVLVRLPKRTKQVLDMVATVDEISMMEVVRNALSEYFDTLDLEWYGKELGKMEKEEESEEESESEPEAEGESEAEPEDEEIKVCPKCKAENPSEANFCVGCGIEFEDEESEEEK